MKSKSIIFFLAILVFVLFISAASNNEKALELIKKGNESYRVNKNTPQAFADFKQAAELASGAVKVNALLKTAYMSHLQGNKITAYKNYLKEALAIDPEKNIEPAEYRSSFRQIFNNFKSSKKIAEKPGAAKSVSKTVPTQPQPSMKKVAGKTHNSKKPLKAIMARPAKFFIRGSYAMGLTSGSQDSSWTEPLFGENIEYSLANKAGKSSNIELGLGYNLGRAFAVGLGGILHSSDLEAALSASVPHPYVFDSPRTATGAYSGTLKSTILYLNFIYRMTFSKFIVDFFAGPAYFNSSAEILNTVAIQDVFPNETVTMSLTAENVKKSGIGFNAGAGLNYFFSKSLGLFLEARYLSGSATFTPTSQSNPGIKLTVGGLNVGAGLVIRF